MPSIKEELEQIADPRERGNLKAQRLVESLLANGFDRDIVLSRDNRRLTVRNLKLSRAGSGALSIDLHAFLEVDESLHGRADWHYYIGDEHGHYMFVNPPIQVQVGTIEEDRGDGEMETRRVGAENPLLAAQDMLWQTVLRSVEQRGWIEGQMPTGELPDGMSTITIYGYSGDGYIFSGDSTYANARAGTGTTLTAYTDARVGQYGTYNCCTAYQHFDTSAIPSYANITTALFENALVVNATVDTWQAQLRSYDWGDTLTTADWDTGSGRTLMATTTISSGSMGVPTWASQSGFLTSINAGGITKVMLTSGQIVGGTAPSNAEYCNFTYEDYTGFANDPRITLTFETMCPVPGVTVGIPALGGTSAVHTANRYYAVQITPAVDCHLDAIWIGVDGWGNTTGGCNFKPFVYTDSSTAPSSLLEDGSAVSIGFREAAQMIRAPLDSSVALTGGTSYWIGYIAESGNQSNYLYSGSTGSVSWYGDGTYSTGPASSAPSGTGTTNGTSIAGEVTIDSVDDTAIGYIDLNSVTVSGGMAADANRGGRWVMPSSWDDKYCPSVWLWADDNGGSDNQDILCGIYYGWDDTSDCPSTTPLGLLDGTASGVNYDETTQGDEFIEFPMDDGEVSIEAGKPYWAVFLSGTTSSTFRYAYRNAGARDESLCSLSTDSYSGGLDDPYSYGSANFYGFILVGYMELTDQQQTFYQNCICTSAALATLERKTMVTRIAGSTPLASIQRSTSKTVAATSTPVASILTGWIRPITLAAVSSAYATLTKAVSKGLTTVSTPVATVTRSSTKTLATTSSAVASWAYCHVYLISLAATSAATASLTKQINKVASTISAATSSLKRDTSVTRSTTSTPVATVTKKTTKGTFTATSAATAAITTLYKSVVYSFIAGRAILVGAKGTAQLVGSVGSAIIKGVKGRASL